MLFCGPLSGGVWVGVVETAGAELWDTAAGIDDRSVFYGILVRTIIGSGVVRAVDVTG